MKIVKRLVFLCVGILWLFIGQSCTPKRTIALPKIPTSTVLIDTNFTAQSLNECVLVCTKLTEKELTRKDLKTWIAKNTVKVSQQKDAILVGLHRQYPEAWFYVQLINQDSLSRQLVVDEFNRVRCDNFEVFTQKNNIIKKWGEISRVTPFQNHALPFFTYAIPITIQAKDTLNLLIHTQRHYGTHEVNLGISNYETYLSQNIVHFISKIFQVILFIICALMMLILGLIFRYKSMLYLCLYVFSLLYVNLSIWGFTDAVSNFTSIGLSGKNVSTFATFLSSMAIHPFLMEWMKVVPKNERLFKFISFALLGMSFIGALFYLMPIELFDRIYPYFDLSSFMMVVSFSTIFWVLLCSVWALYKAKIYYILLGFGVAFIPISIPQILNFISKNPSKLLQINQSTYIFVAIGLSIISVYLLREQLVTRNKLKESLTQLNESMEGIRRDEIEEIGRNLHDNVGNILASSYLTLKKTNIATTEKLLKEAIQEIRFLSHNLVKDEDKPLATKMEDLVSRFNDFSEISFYFNDFSEGRVNQLEKLKQQNIYRIVQEIMTNIIKHSKATEAHIQIFERDKVFQINIEDDGIGIGNYQESKGIGLKNINKRAEIANLKLTIDSTSEGTGIIIDMKNEN